MADHRAESGGVGEVFRTFFLLGLTAFGGPVAHLGYFREALVVRRRWISEAAYADLVALCQFLPGPASSQVGFGLGLIRAGGLLGGIAAWVGFTLPSALVLAAFGLGAAHLGGPAATGIIHGLKLVAVAVVAQAVLGMARTLTPDRTRAAIAFLALALTLLWPVAVSQVLAIVAGAAVGLLACRAAGSDAPSHIPVPVSRRAGAFALILAGGLLLVLPLVATSTGVALFAACYRAGALVFGGGHVVLPLLEASVVAPGFVDKADFLAGYGLAQAVPGPLFTFAAYLGAVADGPLGAALATVGIFLPGLLLVYGALPFWGVLRGAPLAQAAMRGANAAVVGVLAAALYSPVWTSAVATPLDFTLAAGGFLLLTVWQAPPLAVVILLAAAGGLLAG
ncbi:chromate efflux transporter [Aquabacter cavernae]|uniref:chromate efflux transporter n=1 Tax=Aquabacter cavernae TaxID=2496029 RepID=UPI000F8DE8AA|nr:chromate efflux transporter [Aquabacter cavernae]